MGKCASAVYFGSQEKRLPGMNSIFGKPGCRRSTNMQRNLPRILIADDHTLVAEACKKLLESEYEFVPTVSDGRALVRAAVTLKPHLIIVDVAMPLLNGLDAGQQVKESLPSVKLVFLTMNHDADLAAEAFRRGA